VDRSPRLSVIIPAFRAEATIPRVLQALRPQVTADVEVIVVDSSGVQPAAELQARHDWVSVVPQAERTLPGRARNLGAELARGSQLVFLDADAVPAPDWLSQLRGAATGGALAVAGAVANGTPDDVVGSASYLLEFSEFMPGRAGEPRHGASCNLLVDRSAFEAARGFPEDLWPGEDTVLTVPWALRGRLGFAHEALVWHLNRTHLPELIRHQYRLGHSFAAVCDRVEFPHRRFSRWPWLTVAPALRLAALGLRLRGRPRPLSDVVELTPALVLGLLAWTGGLSAGRTFPPNASRAGAGAG
jgi:glycosyltransferase involved in cell wall biosynthesis